jgi:ankyrin repeat protein
MISPFVAIIGYLSLVRPLIDHGADVNAAEARIDGKTALEAAAEHWSIDMLQLLINSGDLLDGSERQQCERAKALAKANGYDVA